MKDHYNVTYTKSLTQEECIRGQVTIKLDPYRVAEIYDTGGGAREQILKKTLRWISKGQTEAEVLKEIICAADRRLEMISEDTVPGNPGYLTYEQAIAWCRENSVEFDSDNPRPTPPSGWHWYKEAGGIYNWTLVADVDNKQPVNVIMKHNVYSTVPIPEKLYTRLEAIAWCITKNIDFGLCSVVPTAPNGWYWSSGVTDIVLAPNQDNIRFSVITEHDVEVFRAGSSN